MSVRNFPACAVAVAALGLSFTEGDKFIFKLKIESPQVERTAIYEGTFSADRLTGTTKYRGIGITKPSHAMRAK